MQSNEHYSMFLRSGGNGAMLRQCCGVDVILKKVWTLTTRPGAAHWFTRKKGRWVSPPVNPAPVGPLAAVGITFPPIPAGKPEDGRKDVQNASGPIPAGTGPASHYEHGRGQSLYQKIYRLTTGSLSKIPGGRFRFFIPCGRSSREDPLRTS